MNRMEVPQDYNTNDSFCQYKLLQSIGMNNTNADTTQDNTLNTHNFNKTREAYLSDPTLDEEVFDYLGNATKNYIISDRKINEEEIEESLEEVTNKQRSTESNKFSKKSSIINSESSNLKNRHQRKSNIFDKENKALTHPSLDQSMASSKKEDADRYTSPSLKAPIESTRDKELLTITVEIGNGQKDNIIIYENDEAQHISDEFWKKHNINDELKAIFTNLIAENIKQVKEEIANEKSEDKLADTTNIDNYQNLSPPSIDYPALSESK